MTENFSNSNFRERIQRIQFEFEWGISGIRGPSDGHLPKPYINQGWALKKPQVNRKPMNIIELNPACETLACDVVHVYCH